MRAAQSHFVRLNGIRLHVLEWGTRTQRPLLLVHGGSAHAHWWDFVVAALGDNYRVLAIDLRGHGDSDWAEPPDYSLATHAADVTALANELQLTDLTVVGHSLGGLVSISSAAALASRLASLVLIDTTGRVNARGLRYLTALSHWPHPVYDSQQEGIRRFRLLPSANAASSAALAHVAGHALRCTAEGTWTLKFDRRALALDRHVDLLPLLQHVQVPTLVVRGALSAHVTAHAFAELQAVLRHGSAGEIAGAYHHVMLDAPHDLARVLLDFFDGAIRDGGTEPLPRSG